MMMADAAEEAEEENASSSSSSSGAASRKSVAPYRSWSPHTLAARDLCVIGGLGGPTLRVMTCSLDRTVVLFDVHACPPSGKQVVRMSLGGPLESVACRPAGDLAFAGSSGGAIYVVDLSAAAAGISAAASADAGAARVLEGHTRAVTALACSLDNVTLVSASEDGSLRVWDMVTRQCLREVQPLNKTALTNCIVRPCAVDRFAFIFDPCCVSHKRSRYVRSSSASGPPCTSRRCAH
jgi:pre-rRNA-processing protein IPI3